uniref:Uncharacterized protein n=1 Tax=Romanomermis culicivorax TaxID=13658 RepID=A0A915HHS5_ROMCU
MADNIARTAYIATISTEAPPTLAAQSPVVVQQQQQQENLHTSPSTAAQFVDAAHFLTSATDAGESTVIDIGQMTAEDLQAMGIQLVDVDDLGNVDMPSAAADGGDGGMMISAEDLAALQREGVQIFHQDGMLIIQQMDGTTTTLMASAAAPSSENLNHQ